MKGAGKAKWLSVLLLTGVFFAVSFGCSGMIATEPALVTIGDDTALAPARINGKWGYIDTSGSFVIPPWAMGRFVAV